MKSLCWLAALTIFVVLTSNGAAADPAQERGRLSDGRAYRIENGMRLIDYIAELEVTADDLRRQNQALEDELEERRQKSGGQEAKRPVVETPLLGAQRAPRSEELPVANSDLCLAKTQPLNARIAELESQLSRGRVEAKACDYQSTDNPLWGRIHQLESQLSEHTSDAARAEREDQEVQLERARRDLRTKSDELADRESDLKTTRSDLESARQELAGLRSQREEASTRASLSSPPIVKVPPERPANDLTNPDAVRKELRNRLAKIQELVIQRKNLLDASKGRSKGVSIDIQPLASKKGESLDTLRILAARVTAEADAQHVEAGLGEIEAALNDDIQVLNRLSHGR